ncbi:MAG: hypothetical protein N7Q72_05095 [Spiroplasma sp. Tabriz.8]|nr:hypothetical protein [Spiroplasma sp. Tabriz.8]
MRVREFCYLPVCATWERKKEQRLLLFNNLWRRIYIYIYIYIFNKLVSLA